MSCTCATAKRVRRRMRLDARYNKGKVRTRIFKGDKQTPRKK